ncbi:uncharacterized protein LOC108678113 [Hyalella azteca]|uniref:Uncharacterized protein LOC108678113 n=1 Tax=Hyalella azteca TaxID=294128 RepID=A0A8B7P7C6_HYAAZ|nr:uncharacterized protein LOC108678113 [Hyalella azteca]
MGGRAVMALALLLSAILVSTASADSALNQTSADAVVNTSLPLPDLVVEKPSDVVDKTENHTRFSTTAHQEPNHELRNTSSSNKTANLTNVEIPSSNETKIVESRTDASSAKEKFFFGSFRTQTHIIVTYSTSTVPLYCLLGTATSACTVGRRRRKRQSVPISLLANEMQDRVESSLSGFDSKGQMREVVDGGKKFFTVWTKFLTTTTLTTTATNTASTISLSYYCTAGSISLPANCG